MYDLLLKNGSVVLNEEVKPFNVLVNNEKIVALLAWGEEPEAKEIVDCTDRLLFPGVIDSHAHLNDPGFTWREDYAHGTAAAAVGGCTTIVDMPLQNEPAMTNAKIMEEKEKKVSPNAYVDYAFWGGLVDYNFEDLKKMDENGVVAFKSFIGPVSPDYVSLSYGQVREAMQIIQSFGGRAGFHCEDYSIIKWEEERAKKAGLDTWRAFLDSRPVVAELIATKAVLDLARETGCKVHICHVSHPEVAEEIYHAQMEGIDVTAETCSHYLSMSEEDVLEKGSICKCAPPLREKDAIEEMWEYVEEGVFSCVGSDHSPCTKEEKSEEVHGVFGAWGGISGIQSILQVMYYEGVVKRGYSPSVLARCLSEGPARTFDIHGKKGEIQVGFDADIVILNPEKEWEITSESLEYINKISAFVGMKGKGYPEVTLVRGKVVAKDGKVVGERGYGCLIKKIK
ncbi:MAG: allantoinase AllB [Lachnospiraceae bacterium]